MPSPPPRTTSLASLPWPHAAARTTVAARRGAEGKEKWRQSEKGDEEVFMNGGWKEMRMKNGDEKRRRVERRHTFPTLKIRLTAHMMSSFGKNTLLLAPPYIIFPPHLLGVFQLPLIPLPL